MVVMGALLSWWGKASIRVKGARRIHRTLVSVGLGARCVSSFRRVGRHAVVALSGDAADANVQRGGPCQQSECLGACADSPVLLVNDRTMCSFMSTDKLDQMIDGLRKAEGVA